MTGVEIAIAALVAIGVTLVLAGVLSRINRVQNSGGDRGGGDGGGASH